VDFLKNFKNLNYKFGFLCFLFLYLGICFFSTVVFAKKKIIPVPAISTSRNDGVEYGTLVTVLFEDEDDDVYAILAPSLTYNEFIGLKSAFRFFYFGEDNQDYAVIVSSSTGIDQKVFFEYSKPKFLGEKLLFYSSVTAFRDSTRRFFGFTAESLDENESNFTQREFAYDFLLGHHFFDHFRLSFGERLRWISIGRGSVPDEPFFKDEFPSIPGAGGGLVLGHRLVLAFDSRDELDIPSLGSLVRFYTEVGQVFNADNGDHLFNGTGLDARKWFPMRDSLFVTVLRGAVFFTTGSKTPFYEKATLGGDDTLRNFGDGRFVDDHYYLLSIEERFRLVRFRLFGVLADWELATFVDIGRVFGKFHNLLDELQVNPGFGIRALVRPNVVGRFDAGFGPEGMTLFLGLGYPF
jgi:outer membrane protein assembly factor BamA